VRLIRAAGSKGLACAAHWPASSRGRDARAVPRDRDWPKPGGGEFSPVTLNSAQLQLDDLTSDNCDIGLFRNGVVKDVQVWFSSRAVRVYSVIAVEDA